MNDHDSLLSARSIPNGAPENISRRRFLLSSAGAATGALVIGLGIPTRQARAEGAADGSSQMAPGTNVPAFLEIRPDNTVRFLSPFNEGGPLSAHLYTWLISSLCCGQVAIPIDTFI